jgi:hypothetical protein
MFDRDSKICIDAREAPATHLNASTSGLNKEKKRSND